MADIGSAVEGAIQDSIDGTMAQSGSLASIADAAYDKAVAAEEEGNDGTGTEESEGTTAPTTTDEGTEVEGGDKNDAGAEKESAQSDGDSEEGYYADEGQDEVEKQDLATDKGSPTDMGKWVLDELPNIYVMGTNKAGDQISMSVKRAEDLPADFDFLSKRDELIFSQNIADQTNRAVNLVNKWNTDQQQSNAAKFSQQENRDIQLDIASLQREGQLGRFKHQPTDAQFEKDPSVQHMQKVLDYYNEQNQKRYAESQRTGRLFSRLSYRDAFYLHERQNSTDTTSSPEQTKADTSRKAATKVLAKGAKGQGDSSATPRPRLRKNAGVDEIIEAYGL